MPALAQALTRHGTTQVIHLAPIPDDDDFAAVMCMVFGPVGREEVTNMHRASGGAMGRVVHLARRQGLTPPHNVDAGEIRRFPATRSP